MAITAQNAEKAVCLRSRGWSGGGQPLRVRATGSDNASRGARFRTNVSRGLILSLFLAVPLCLWPVQSYAQAARGMTVRDSVEKETFVGNAYEREKVINFSPDGRYFFVITQHCVLQTNQVEATIRLFKSIDMLSLLRGPSNGLRISPRTLAKFATTSNHEPITEARWAPDSENIAFLGLNSDGSERHLFNVDIKDGRLRAVKS